MEWRWREELIIPKGGRMMISSRDLPSSRELTRSREELLNPKKGSLASSVHYYRTPRRR
jgi:hypothetical protein